MAGIFISYRREETAYPAGWLFDRLAKELSAILARPDVKEKFNKIGLPVVADGPAAFMKRVQHEVPMYKEVIDKAGLKIHFGGA